MPALQHALPSPAQRPCIAEIHDNLIARSRRSRTGRAKDQDRRFYPAVPVDIPAFAVGALPTSTQK